MYPETAQSDVQLVELITGYTNAQIPIAQAREWNVSEGQRVCTWQFVKECCRPLAAGTFEATTSEGVYRDDNLWLLVLVLLLAWIPDRVEFR